jgi:hypothetical protein
MPRPWYSSVRVRPPSARTLQAAMSRASMAAGECSVAPRECVDAASASSACTEPMVYPARVTRIYCGCAVPRRSSPSHRRRIGVVLQRPDRSPPGESNTTSCAASSLRALAKVVMEGAGLTTSPACALCRGRNRPGRGRAVHRRGPGGLASVRRPGAGNRGPRRSFLRSVAFGASPAQRGPPPLSLNRRSCR